VKWSPRADSAGCLSATTHEAADEPHDRALAATGRPHERHGLPLLQSEGDVSQDGLALLVGEAHVLEADARRPARQGRGLGRRRHGRCEIEGREDAVCGPTGPLDFGELLRQRDDGPVDHGHELGEGHQQADGHAALCHPARAQPEGDHGHHDLEEAQAVKEAVLHEEELHREAVVAPVLEFDPAPRPARAAHGLQEARGGHDLGEQARQLAVEGALLAEARPHGPEDENRAADHHRDDQARDREEAHVAPGQDDHRAHEDARGGQDLHHHGAGQRDETLGVGFDAAHQHAHGQLLQPEHAEAEELAEERALDRVDRHHAGLAEQDGRAHGRQAHAHHEAEVGQGRGEESADVAVGDVDVDDARQDQRLGQAGAHGHEAEQEGDAEGQALGLDVGIDAPEHLQGREAPLLLAVIEMVVPPHGGSFPRRRFFGGVRRLSCRVGAIEKGIPPASAGGIPEMIRILIPN